MVDPAERERLRQPPEVRPVLRQFWRRLLFLHFPVEPSELAHLIPPGLDIDLFPDASGEPKAWVGVVPFEVIGARVAGMPPLPFLSSFPEINVRTYVHRKGKDPSVLFLSLDGGLWPIRGAARASYGTPYVRSYTEMKAERDGFRFRSRRPNGRGSDFFFAPRKALGVSESGTLEYFLLERYQLIQPVRGGFKKSRIWHVPYEPFHAEFEGTTDLPEAHGIRTRPFVHAVFCDHLDVRFYPPVREAL